MKAYTTREFKKKPYKTPERCKVCFETMTDQEAIYSDKCPACLFREKLIKSLKK